MFGLGTWEMLVILLALLLLFGAKRLPSLGKGLGEGMRSFRDAIKGEKGSDEEDPSHPNNKEIEDKTKA